MEFGPESHSLIYSSVVQTSISGVAQSMNRLCPVLKSQTCQFCLKSSDSSTCQRLVIWLHVVFSLTHSHPPILTHLPILTHTIHPHLPILMHQHPPILTPSHSHLLTPSLPHSPTTSQCVDIQPNDGFGTLLPRETISLDIIFSASKPKDYCCELSCLTEINRSVRK